MAPIGQGKMANLIGSRMRVIMADSREMVGEMLAFDKHMNLVLADTEEFRIVKRKNNKSSAPGSSDGLISETKEKRPLGLTIVRGTHIITLTIESGPHSDPAARLGAPTPAGAAAGMVAGPGISKPVGRGLPIGLQGPAPGMGGAAPPAGFPGFPGGAPPGFPGAPPGFGRGGPPGGMPAGFPGVPMPGGLPAGFQPPPGFQVPPGQGRGYPPGGFPPGR